MRNQQDSKSTFQNPEIQWKNKVEQELGKDFVEKILSFKDLNIEEFKDFNNKIQEFIKNRIGGITNSRMRKIYELIKKAKTPAELLFTLPYLAYIVGKEDERRKKENIGELYIVLKNAIERLENSEQLKNIQKFTEALVAYQKFYGKD